MPKYDNVPGIREIWEAANPPRHMSWQADTGGIQIIWRERQIEHYTISAKEGETRDQMLIYWVAQLKMLQVRCKHLEKIGVTPTSSSVIWCWPWFEGQHDHPDPCLDILAEIPGLYQHGCSARNAEILQQAHVPVKATPINGTLAFVPQQLAASEILIFDPKATEPTERVRREPVDEKEFVNTGEVMYHYMRGRGYMSAMCGQNPGEGPCYAPYHSIRRWMEDHGMTAVDANRIADILVEIEQECREARHG